MQSISLLIKQKSLQIKQTKEKSLKRQYSQELGQLQHQLTLLLTQKSTEPKAPFTNSYIPFDEWKSLSTIGDRVKALDKPLRFPEELQIQ